MKSCMIAGVRVPYRWFHEVMMPEVHKRLRDELSSEFPSMSPLERCEALSPKSLEQRVRRIAERILSLKAGRPVSFSDKSWSYWRNIIALDVILFFTINEKEG